MNKKDINKMIRWAVDTDGIKLSSGANALGLFFNQIKEKEKENGKRKALY